MARVPPRCRVAAGEDSSPGDADAHPKGAQSRRPEAAPISDPAIPDLVRRPPYGDPIGLPEDALESPPQEAPIEVHRRESERLSRHAGRGQAHPDPERPGQVPSHAGLWDRESRPAISRAV